MARQSVRCLEKEMHNKVYAERQRRKYVIGDVPLPLNVFTEILSGSAFFNAHGVLTRRCGIIDFEAEQALLEASISNIGRSANFGSSPTLAEVRDILHPPFESFGAVAIGAPDNVIRVDFTTGQKFEPVAEIAPIISVPA